MFLALSMLSGGGASCVSTLDGVHARAFSYALMEKRRLETALV